MKYSNFILICKTSYLNKVLSARTIRTLLRFYWLQLLLCMRTNPHTDYSCVNELKWDHCGLFFFSFFFFCSATDLWRPGNILCTNYLSFVLKSSKPLWPSSQCCSHNYTSDSRAFWLNNIFIFIFCKKHIDNISLWYRRYFISA